MYIKDSEATEEEFRRLLSTVEHAYLFATHDYDTALHYARMSDLTDYSDEESVRWARLHELQLRKVCCDQEINALNSAALRARLGHE